MQHTYSRLFTRIAGFVVLAAAAGATHAQSLSGTNADDGIWRHTVSPFLFLPLSTEGTSVVDDGAVELDLNLGDVLDLLQGAASFRYEGWRGDFGIISELYYVRLGEDGSLPLPSLSADVDVDVRQTYLSFMAAYRFADGVNASGRRYALDASAGLRWNRLKQEIDLEGPGPGMDLGGTEEWIEPVIGLRYAVELNDDWTFATRAELGGFGVNDDDLQYLVLAGFDWARWENTSLRFGYQFYGIDYSTHRSNGEFAYDIDQHGLYAGIAFRF